MIEATTWAEEVINEFATQNPPAARLARIVSLAARVEPELLRAVRLRLLPHADAGVEADLWFSPLVQSQSPLALAMEPQVVDVLRMQLAAEPGLLHGAWAVLREVHRDAPATLQLEEQITWLALVGTDEALQRIDEVLRPVVAAMVQQDRRGLSRWVLRAFPRMPHVVHLSETVQMLAMGAGARLGGQRILKADLPRHAVREWLPWILPVDVPKVLLGVRLVDNTCQVREPPHAGDHTIEVPRTDPLLLEVSWQEGADQFAELIRLSSCSAQSVAVGTADVQLRTATGSRYTLRRRAVGKAVPWRTVRIYICSTFRDMQAERDHLVRVVFPELRSRCETRRIHLIDIDMRWGVTQEQADSGDALALRLQRIDECRPFFVGILGEQYGWVPDRHSDELLRQHPWLVEHAGCSSVHLEIIYALRGIAGSPSTASGASIYLRDPSFLQPAEFVSSTAEERIRLDSLKQHLRRSGLPLFDGYAGDDLKTFGQTVLENLWTAIQAHHPETSEPDTAAERQSARHEVYARERMRVFVGRQDYFARLDQNAVNDGPPVVVVGPPGSGKSALLANWGVHFQRSRPDDLVFMHFAGAVENAKDAAALARRLIGALNTAFGNESDISEQRDDLRAAFVNRLQAAAAQAAPHGRRIVIVIDGLDDLDAAEGGALNWWPQVVPTSVRLVASARPGPLIDECIRRGWTVIELAPLTEAEQASFIRYYLSQYGKALEDAQVARIVQAPQMSNPVFLVTLLEELRVIGSFEAIDRRIQQALMADSLELHFDQVLSRCEADHGRELVRDVLSLIWTSRRGLSELELRGVLGEGERPLAGGIWSPLYQGLERFLQHRGDLLDFFHRAFRTAVERRYFSDADAKRVTHQRLADHFQSFASRKLDPHQAEELLWQLAQAQDWVGLRRLLTDPVRFETLWVLVPAEVTTAWDRLNANAPQQVNRAYEVALEQLQRNTRHSACMAELLEQTGHLSEARAIWKALAALHRAADNRAQLQHSLGRQAALLEMQSRLDEALAALREQHEVCEATADRPALLKNLADQAGLLCRRGIDLANGGQHEAALHGLAESEALCRQIGHSEILCRVLVNRGTILGNFLGQWDRALAAFEEASALAAALPSTDLLAQIEALRGTAAAARWQSIRDTQFTLCVPRSVRPEVWFPLVAFVHDEVGTSDGMVEAIEHEARAVLGDRYAGFRQLTQDSLCPVPIEAELIFVLEAEGIEFNPPRQTVARLADWQRAEFRLRAAQQLDGEHARGRLSVFCGAVLVADFSLRIEVDSSRAEPRKEPAPRPHRTIYACYSHRDRHIVEQFAQYGKILGDEYLIDVLKLRAGENWHKNLRKLIDEADVFQLFWSENAKQSEFVREEIRYALQSHKPNFIRPVCWETPLPEPPPELRHLHFTRIEPSVSRAEDSQRRQKSAFISGVVRTFQSHRLLINDTLLRLGFAAVVQEFFSTSFDSTVEAVREKISRCDLVICLVGPVYGSAPKTGNATSRSYAQIEYDLARDLGKPFIVFMPRADCPLDQLQSTQTDREARLQQQFIDEILQVTSVVTYGSLEELRRRMEAALTEVGDNPVPGAT